MAAMSRRKVLLGVAAGLLCFVAGVSAARFFGVSAPAEVGRADAGGVSLFPDAGPKILFDPDSIQLLPDASLRLDLPQPFDGGEREPSAPAAPARR